MSGFVTATTRKAYRSDLSSFYRWGCRRNLIESNPMLMIDPIKVPRSMPKPATAEAIATAMIISDVDTQTMILLGALAGLRVAEIAALTNSDLHLDAEPPVIHVRNGKGKRDRIVPIHPTLLAHLRLRTSWLYRPRGRRYTANRVSRRLQKVLSTDGRRVTAHQLRHYFGTEAARWSRGNVVLVGQLMGHEHTQTTMGYIGWSPTEGYEVVSKIVTSGVDDEFTQRRLRSA